MPLRLQQVFFVEASVTFLIDRAHPGVTSAPKRFLIARLRSEWPTSLWGQVEERLARCLELFSRCVADRRYAVPTVRCPTCGLHWR